MGTPSAGLGRNSIGNCATELAQYYCCTEHWCLVKRKVMWQPASGPRRTADSCLSLQIAQPPPIEARVDRRDDDVDGGVEAERGGVDRDVVVVDVGPVAAGHRLDEPRPRP